MNENKVKKILEICPFSAGICGVWQRVLSESKEFEKLGYEVRVFSSDIEKGTGRKSIRNEEIKRIKIKRFKSNADWVDKLISKNVTYFDFEKEFLEYHPDIVITHLLHPHSFKALKICSKNKIPCYLVTHAPFNIKRGFPLNILTFLYGYMIKPNLKWFTKIIAVTKWELPYLEELGVDNHKIIYIPNGLPEEFFTQKKEKASKDVLFLGRISPVKNLEILVKTAKLLPKINFNIVGFAEEKYLNKINQLINNLKIKNVSICLPVYDLSEKIKLIDEHKIFVLPSKREAMPQVLLEAMARGKISISSKTDGGKEIIKDGQNGFLFEIGDYQSLAKIIKNNLTGNKKIQKNAIKDAQKYAWQKLIKYYLSLFNK